MPLLTLQNAFCSVQINSLGAELFSIQNKALQQEYLWQGDPAVWGRRAPVLFPIVGKASEDHVLIEGEKYAMGQHGFARDAEFSIAKQEPEHCLFRFSDTDQTRDKYPFPFELNIGYRLHEKTITNSYSVRNTGNSILPFSIGAHPGFLLPVPDLSAYYIAFEQEEPLMRHLLQDGLFNGQTEKLNTEGNRLYLSTALLAKDALVFKNLRSAYVRLCHKESTYAVQVSLAGFPYLGIWTKPGQEAFLCIEPWCGLADSIGAKKELKEKEGIITLAPGELFSRSFSMTIA